MSRTMNTVLKWGVVGVVAYAVQQTARAGTFGPQLQDVADEIQKVFVFEGSDEAEAEPDSAPSTPSTPSTPPTASSPPTIFVLSGMTDLDGFPVVYDHAIRTIRQDPRIGGTNIYRVGHDVFRWAGGIYFLEQITHPKQGIAQVNLVDTETGVRRGWLVHASHAL